MFQEFRFILLLTLIILAIAFFVLGIMLRHHWHIYSPHQALGRLVQTLYWVIGGALLAVMTTAYFTSFI